MFITKKYLSRRSVLRGAGVAIALPLLDSMLPAQTPTRKTAAAAKTRLACIQIPHGAGGSCPYGRTQHYWSPVKEGADFDFTLSLKPLESFRDYLTVISDTDCTGADPKIPEEVGADHTRSAAVFLTAAHPKMTEGADYYCGTSIDQIYSKKFGQETPLPSIELQVEDPGALVGSCGFRYSCVYKNTISWASPTTPLPMERDPRVVFERLFGDGGTPEERNRRRSLDRSILDRITDKAAQLKLNLDVSDRNKLTNYLDNIRELERRIQKIEKQNTSNPERELPIAPVGVPDSWDEHIKLMADLQVLGFQADITRVSSLMMARDVSSRVYPESGVRTPFHSGSHHGEVPVKIEEFARLNRYHVSTVAYFVNQMKATPDGDGNLLDHSLVLYGSPMGNANIHEHRRVPMLLLGHANGQLKGNLHVVCPTGTPQANILLTVMQKLGVPMDSIGDSTGTVAI
jgi:hypothetical protein